MAIESCVVRLHQGSNFTLHFTKLIDDLGGRNAAKLRDKQLLFTADPPVSILSIARATSGSRSHVLMHIADSNPVIHIGTKTAWLEMRYQLLTMHKICSL